jgi:hypothetical protein
MSLLRKLSYRAQHPYISKIQTENAFVLIPVLIDIFSILNRNKNKYDFGSGF